MRLDSAVKERLEAENLSYRDAAEKIGVSHSTVARALKDENLDVRSLKRICDWLGVTINDVVYEQDSPEEMYQDIAMLFSMSTSLKDAMKNLAVRIKENDLDENILEELAAFTYYQMDRNRK